MAFFELNIAMTGLFAAKQGLQVTSNNITNTNTTGYSRQQLSQKASNPLSGFNVGMIGTGVETTGIHRVRDSFIDHKLWGQNPQLGEYNIKVTQNSIVESAFGEPAESGFTKVFNNMFESISDLSTNPSAKESKAVLKENMESFAKYYNNIAASLEKQQKDINFEVKESVKKINDLAIQIQSLNKQIFEAEIYGDDANNFRDQREHCIDQLSQMLPVDTSETEYEVEGNIIKKYTVSVGGETLVDHFNVNTLEIKVRETKQNPRDIEGLYDVVWESGNKLDPTKKGVSGELKGLLDIRDGAGTGATNTYNGVPYYLNRLDEYVRTFARAMNEQYSSNEDGSISTPMALFSYTNPTGETISADLIDYSELNATNFSVSKEIKEDPTSMRTLYDESNPSDTSFMLKLLAQKDNVEMFKEGNPKDYMVAIFSELGINTSESVMYQDTQKAITNNLKNQRLSVSQVDVSEEFTYLIQYQQAYQAAAKIMNTIDGIYETTIFKLGNF